MNLNTNFGAMRHAAVAFMLFATQIVYAQAPIRLIVPFSPGGTADQIGRTLAEEVTRQTGRAVIVENVAGAGGIIGMSKLGASPVDGSVVGLLATSVVRMHGIDRTPFPKLDVIAGLGPIAMAVVVPQNSSATNLRSLPRNLVFGSSGQGAASHTCIQTLNKALGANAEELAFRGTGPLVMEAIAGQPILTCLEIPVVAPHIDSGKLKILAVAAPHRSPKYPGVPTLSELRLTDTPVWNAYTVVAPAGMSAQMKGDLTSAFAGAIAAAQPKLSSFGFPFTTGSEAGIVSRFDTQIREEIERSSAGSAASAQARDAAPSLPPALPQAREPASQSSQSPPSNMARPQAAAGSGAPARSGSSTLPPTPSGTARQAGAFVPPPFATHCVITQPYGSGLSLGNRCADRIMIVAKWIWRSRFQDGYELNRKVIPANPELGQTIIFQAPVEQKNTACFTKDAGCNSAWLALLQHCNNWDVTNKPGQPNGKGIYSSSHGPMAMIDGYGFARFIGELSSANRERLSTGIPTNELGRALKTAYWPFLEEANRNRRNTDSEAVSCAQAIYPRMLAKMDQVYVEVGKANGLTSTANAFSTGVEEAK